MMAAGDGGGPRMDAAGTAAVPGWMPPGRRRSQDGCSRDGGGPWGRWLLAGDVALFNGRGPLYSWGVLRVGPDELSLR